MDDGRLHRLHREVDLPLSDLDLNVSVAQVVLPHLKRKNNLSLFSHERHKCISLTSVLFPFMDS